MAFGADLWRRMSRAEPAAVITTHYPTDAGLGVLQPFDPAESAISQAIRPDRARSARTGMRAAIEAPEIGPCSESGPRAGGLLRTFRRCDRICVEVMAMRWMLSIALAGVLLLASTAQAVAHHSGAAEFDVNSHIELTGVVTKVEWTNPHAHFYVDVADAAGKVANW